MKNLFIMVGLLITITTTAQQKKETTLDLLKHTVWEHGKPIYGNYIQIAYTDSTMIMWRKDSSGKLHKSTCLFYLTDEEEFSFDQSKVGKVMNGKFYMKINEYGTFISNLIVESSKDKLSISPLRVQGKLDTIGVPWNYTPMKEENSHVFFNNNMTSPETK